MINLKNLSIVLTGATCRIGFSILDNLFNAGANVLATGTRIEKLEELNKNFEEIKILKFDIAQHNKKL